ncbi:MAG TPA: agmatine deiminase family protein [Candidatus Angelobacter sp.]|nr:agmatine deiminase family protein [Candidatus Angelobacter sp.]
MASRPQSQPSVATPRGLGYRMPAEWEPHAATWIAWPHNRTDWPGKFDAIPWVYAEIIRYLIRSEKVHLIVRSAGERGQVRDVLERSSVGPKNIVFHTWPTNRCWMRDSGPIFVTRKNARDRIALTNWRFNAWAKYPNWKLDDQIPDRIADCLSVEQFTPVFDGRDKPYRVVLEGGSIDVNGQGLMLTTEECLLSKVQQRNPRLTRADLEQVFADYLGIKKVIWLGRGIVGDDTHGHVDDIARFVASNTIVTVIENNRSDPNYRPLQENRLRLARATDLRGRKLRIVDLPLPRPVVFQGQRLPASYANFYIANSVVLVPTFNDPNDRLALNILANLFPEREVVGIYCGDFIWGLGAIHCMTQQQSA